MAKEDTTSKVTPAKVSKTQLAVALHLASNGAITPYAAAQHYGITPQVVTRALQKLAASQTGICPTCKRPLEGH
jgi:DNA-binding MarR family transcriptional regulator